MNYDKILYLNLLKTNESLYNR
eukprot:UN13928